jgi:hypothetical protein
MSLTDWDDYKKNWKTYQCKIKGKKGEWIKIDAEDPEMAVCEYAESYGIQDGEKVVVRGVGSFDIQIEEVYNASKW